MSKSDTEKTIEILVSTERVADQILTNKQEIISLDRRRQDNREAIREVQKSEEQKVWISVGSLLVKMEKDKALKLLHKDQVQIDTEINKLRSDQKLLVNKLRDLEHLSPFTGTNIQPLTAKEMSTIRSNFPLI